jgi:hypothetical protein
MVGSTKLSSSLDPETAEETAKTFGFAARERRAAMTWTET